MERIEFLFEYNHQTKLYEYYLYHIIHSQALFYDLKHIFQYNHNPFELLLLLYNNIIFTILFLLNDNCCYIDRQNFIRIYF